jgi:hypothetical protein
MFAGVSTGTAHTTVQTLLQRKDLIERGDGLAFTNFDRLLDEWVTLYPSLLRESLKLGRYRATEPNWWTDMLASNDEWMLGGESAAALMTNYLKPAVVTVYCTNGIPTQMISRGPPPTSTLACASKAGKATGNCATRSLAQEGSSPVRRLSGSITPRPTQAKGCGWISFPSGDSSARATARLNGQVALSG